MDKFNVRVSVTGRVNPNTESLIKEGKSPIDIQFHARLQTLDNMLASHWGQVPLLHQYGTFGLVDMHLRAKLWLFLVSLAGQALTALLFKDGSSLAITLLLGRDPCRSKATKEVPWLLLQYDRKANKEPLSQQPLRGRAAIITKIVNKVTI